MGRKLTRLVCILSLLISGVPWAVAFCVHEDGFVHTITDSTLENHPCPELSCEYSESKTDGFDCQGGHQCEDVVFDVSSDFVFPSRASRDTLPQPTVCIAIGPSPWDLILPRSCILSSTPCRAPPDRAASVHLSIVTTVLRI